jgi:C_GCAxxG_C_C family probable redox protein
MSARSDVAVEKLLSGYNCAQSVLYAFCDDLGLDKDAAMKMACGFGGGMGRAQEVCGAISGGVFALGVKHGRGEGQDKSATDETYLKVRELLAQFAAERGSTICRTLLGCDLNTPEGHDFFQQNDLRNRTCKRCVETAVEAVDKIL